MIIIVCEPKEGMLRKSLQSLFSLMSSLHNSYHSLSLKSYFSFVICLPLFSRLRVLLVSLCLLNHTSLSSSVSVAPSLSLHGYTKYGSQNTRICIKRHLRNTYISISIIQTFHLNDKCGTRSGSHVQVYIYTY